VGYRSDKRSHQPRLTGRDKPMSAYRSVPCRTLIGSERETLKITMGPLTDSPLIAPAQTVGATFSVLAERCQQWRAIAVGYCAALIATTSPLPAGAAQ